MTAMEHRNEDTIAFISGIIGSILAINLAQITWDGIWSNIANLLWLGTIALFSGAMGVIGKKLVGKIMKLINHRKSKNRNQHGKQ